MTGSNNANRDTYSNKLPGVTYVDVEINRQRERAVLFRAALAIPSPWDPGKPAGPCQTLKEA